MPSPRANVRPLHPDYEITLVTTLLVFVAAQICGIFSFNLKLQQG